MNQKFVVRFAMLWLFIASIPGIGLAQNKNVLNTFRVFPKIDKVMEFEKALANHAQKYHSGDVAWRVSEITSGPDAGGYLIVEGPTSWEGLDTRGDLGHDHQVDWYKNVAIYLTEKQSALYAVYVDSLSTSALTDYAGKSTITHIYPKLGKNWDVVKMIGKLKKGWMANGAQVAVYDVNASGRSQIILATRHKEGLKEKTPGFRKSLVSVYKSIHGEESWANFNEALSENLNDSWSEILIARKDLGSK